MLDEIKTQRRQLHTEQHKLTERKLKLTQEELLAVKEKREVEAQARREAKARGVNKKLKQMQEELARQKALLKKQESTGKVLVQEIKASHPDQETRMEPYELLQTSREASYPDHSDQETEELIQHVQKRLEKTHRQHSVKSLTKEMRESVSDAIGDRIEAIGDADPLQLDRERDIALTQIKAEAKAKADAEALASARRIAIIKRRELKKIAASMAKKQAEREAADGQDLIHPMRFAKMARRKLSKAKKPADAYADEIQKALELSRSKQREATVLMGHIKDDDKEDNDKREDVIKFKAPVEETHAPEKEDKDDLISQALKAATDTLAHQDIRYQATFDGSGAGDMAKQYA